MKKYPRIEQFGLKIDRNAPIPIISWNELNSPKLSDAQIETLDGLLRGQTCSTEGHYIYDVEVALERMESGKLTGAQREWD